MMTDLSIAKEKLKAPAIAMMVSAGISLATCLFQLLRMGELLMQLPGGTARGDTARLLIRAFQTLLILGLPALAFSIYAAVQMMNLRNYGFAITGAIINIAFGFVGCFLISVPVGIWALIVLLKPETRAAFADKTVSAA